MKMKWAMIVFAGALALVGCQHLPQGGKIGITFEVAKKLRAQAPAPVLINGNPVDKAKYPHVIRIFVGGSSCTASVVGARTILTAAHCAENGETISFQTVSGKKYTAKAVRAPGYPGKDLDLLLANTSVDIDVKPVSVRLDRFEKKGMEVDLIGYGCTKPGGSGGNDGILRAGKSKVAAGQEYDLVLKTDGGAALCYGDSGGPVFFEGQQIAVNSKGNIEDTSYVTRLTLPDGAQFLKDFAQSKGVFICGVNSDCSGGTPPPPFDGKYKFENEKLAIEVFLK